MTGRKINRILTGAGRGRRVCAIALALALALSSCGLLPGLLREKGDPCARAASLMEHFEDRYFLSALDDRRLGAVCDIYEAAMDFEDSCGLSRLTSEELGQVLTLMAAECPELFQLNSTGSFTGLTDRSGRFVSLDLTYLMDKSEYEKRRRECEDVLAGFARDTAGLAPEERERFVFDAVAASCRYDLASPCAGTAWGALIDHRAKCDGVSAAFKWAMEALGIPCVTLTADVVGGVVGHAWNAVELDGVWYRVDLTQSTRIAEFENAGLTDVIYYAFNISDDFVTERYAVLDAFASVRPLPACTTMDRSYYALHGLFIENDAQRDQVAARELAALPSTGGTITLQFATPEAAQAFPSALAPLIAASYPYPYASWTCQTLPYNVCVVTVKP